MRLLDQIAILVSFQAIVGTAVAASDSEPRAVSHQRVHIENAADYPQIYELLTSYITNPELASSVKEIQFRPHKFRQIDLSICPQYKQEEDDGRHHQGWMKRINTAIHNVTSSTANTDGLVSQSVEEHLPFLSDELRDKYIAALMWMKPEAIAHRKKISDEVKNHPGLKCQFEVLVDAKDHEFVYHATALLLLLCPNLERLVYRDNNELNNVVKDVLRRNNYDSPVMPPTTKYLANLKDVVLLPTDDILFGDDRYYIAMDILELMRMFHRLPNINSISAGGLGGPREWSPSLFPAATSNLKRITIVHSQFDSKIIEALVRAPKALTEFTMTTGGRALPGGMYSPTQVKSLGKALQCQKSSLIKLDLDLGTTITDHESGWFTDDQDPNGEPEQRQDRPLPEFTADEWHDLESRARKIDDWEAQSPSYAMELRSDREYGKTMGSLHDFTQLLHLSIGTELLFSCCCCQTGCREGTSLGVPFRLVDALPPNLEYLKIRGYSKGKNPEVDEHFAEFLKLKSERFPNLKEIHGINEFIPGGEHVRYPDRDTHLLWKSEDTVGFGSPDAEQQSLLQPEIDLNSPVVSTTIGTRTHDEI